MERIGHWIDGQHRPGSSGRSQPVWNPATGEAQAEVDLASAAEVDAAVASALAAFPEWSAKSLAARTQVMFRFRELLDGNRKALAELVSREHGKTAADADGEIARGLDNVDFACGLAQLLKGSYSDSVSSGIDVYSLRQPLGVVAGITPFNFPAMVPLWMIPTAIACGNAFILKPSERDPSASLMLADLLRQAGVPDGVVNVVQGDREAVERLLEHPDVQAVSFVGSTDIARHIYATGTSHGKRVQALGGAKNHMVVLPDADLEMAADAAVSAGYGSAGERCMAISVVVAVGAVGDPLVDAIAQRLPGIQVGTGTGGASEMGPLITAQHRDRVAGYLAQAPEEGAEVVVDGRDVPAAAGPGFYLGASLIDHVKPGSRAHQEEIFGPVLSVVRVDTYEQAMDVVGNLALRQRRGHLHPRRWGGPPVHARGAGRHGGCERPDPGAGRAAELRRLEGFAVRRSAHVRPGGHAVLHPGEGRHLTLARHRRNARRCATRLPTERWLTMTASAR